MPNRRDLTETSDDTLEAIAPPPELSAREAGLRYVCDDHPGFTRRRRGKGFSYHDTEGKLLKGKERERIALLVIPPAWTDVWISPWKNGHIQATGRDEAGRKQYIYHEKWRRIRDETKYNRMIAFGEALPGIREQVDRDMRLRRLCREKVLALVVHLLDATGIRVGNDEYAEEYGSFGLTTLRKRHVEVNGSRLKLEFTGKKGVKQVLEITNARAARAVRKCEELPGYELFQYIDESGERNRVDSDDVNDYLHGIAGDGFTAKDFRTWVGTVLAIRELARMEKSDDEKIIRQSLTEMVRTVAKELGNTPAVCRKHYIHPEVIRAFSEGEFISLSNIPANTGRNLRRWLSDEELGLLAFLKRCAKTT